MPKDLPEEKTNGIPDDFVGAAAAEGITVPESERAGNRTPENKKPDVVVSDEPDTTDRQPAPRRDGKKGSEGYDRIDFKTATPEQIEQRFKRLYRQVKATDENQRLQGAALEKVLRDKQALEAKLAAKDSEDAIQNIRTKLKTARDSGDFEAEDRYRDQLVALTTELEVNKRLKPAAPKEGDVPPAAPAPRQSANAYSTLSATDRAVISRWANAEDGEGNLIRPWANNPDNTRASLATELLAKALQDPEMDDMTMEEKLAAVDEQMGTRLPVPRRGNTSPVMGSNLMPQAGAAKPKITSEQAKIAKKLFPHLKEQDAYRAYLDGGL